MGDGMRLFIAINFEDQIKEKIQEIINELEKSSIQGRFVSKDHLHLTLEFLGEIPDERVDVIKKIMDEANLNPFTLKLSGVGYFKRPQGNIYWLGLEENQNLMDTKKQFINSLQTKDLNLKIDPIDLILL